MEDTDSLCDALRSGTAGTTRTGPPDGLEKVLTQNLWELEACGVVVRKDLSDVVLHIEYELREDTKDDLCALLDHLGQWEKPT